MIPRASPPARVAWGKPRASGDDPDAIYSQGAYMW